MHGACSTHRVHYFASVHGLTYSSVYVHGLDVLADLENVKQFIQKQKLLKSFGLTVHRLTVFSRNDEVQLHVGPIYVLYVHVPVVVDSVRCACMLQWKQMMISYLVTFLIIHCLNSASRDLLSKCVKCLLVPRLCVVPVFMYVYTNVLTTGY